MALSGKNSATAKEQLLPSDFFHFILQAMRDIIEPLSWAGKFNMPALSQLLDGTGISSYSIPKPLVI